MKTKVMNLLMIAALFTGCAPQVENEESISVENLKAVEAEFVPESISVTSGAGISAQTSDDVCAGLDFVECQPRLIRVYLLYGRAAVGTTLKVVSDVAKSLSGAPDNSSGVVHDSNSNMSIEYNKRSLLDFDLLIKRNGISVGRVLASPALYNIQFDLNVIDADKPESRGGKIDVQVNFTDRTHWHSQITITGQKCMEAKPDDLKNARIAVTRDDELWTAQSMFYSPIGASLGTKTCSTPVTDDSGLVIYTDVVADRIAAKASLYVMQRNETNTAQIQNFGFPGLCTNYPDLCQSIANEGGVSTADLNTHLGTMANPYCVLRGSPSVTWNSTCQSQSAAVSSAPFLSNAGWMAPYDFYQYDVTIPEHL